jgi:predicted Zn-dependent peptidase
MFERTALPHGPRVISARLPAARSVSIAAYVLAGSRLEADDHAGVAHFMEHITFKGTAAFPSSRAIAEAIEGVGGSFNAATDRESTVYWVRVPRREAQRGMDVLGELIVRPVLAEHEIDHERTVIVEEIRSYMDDPVEYAHILFQQAMFGPGPLGREICGDETTIRTMPTAAIHDFWGRMYRPANVVIAVAGDLDHAEALDLAAGAFGTGNGIVPGFVPSPVLPAGERYMLEHRDTTQAQLVVGVPALPRDHPDAWVLGLMNVVLGDGMSSRLFLTVREEKALAYDVSSGVLDYADAGALEVSAGVDPVNLGAALEAILAELGRLRDEPISDHEVDKAKSYLAGALEAVHAVTAEDMQRVARELFRDEALRLAVVAPPRRGRGLERKLRLP